MDKLKETIEGGLPQTKFGNLALKLPFNLTLFTSGLTFGLVAILTIGFLVPRQVLSDEYPDIVEVVIDETPLDEPIPEPIPEPEPPIEDVPVKERGTYTVVWGDTLIEIASKHNITLDELMSWNGITSSLIHPDEVFFVTPETVPATEIPNN